MRDTLWEGTDNRKSWGFHRIPTKEFFLKGVWAERSCAPSYVKTGYIAILFGNRSTYKPFLREGWDQISSVLYAPCLLGQDIGPMGGVTTLSQLFGLNPLLHSEFHQLILHELVDCFDMIQQNYLNKCPERPTYSCILIKKVKLSSFLRELSK